MDFIEACRPRVSDRSEVDQPQPAVDGGHHHWWPIIAFAVRPGRYAAPLEASVHRFGRPGSSRSSDQVLRWMRLMRFQVLAPVVRTRKGEFVDLSTAQHAGSQPRAVDGVAFACRPAQLKNR